MITGVFAFFLLAISFDSHVASAEPLTLESALASAYLSNPQLEAQRAALRATDEEVAKALSGWRPSISFSGSYGWREDRQTLSGATTTSSTPQSGQVIINQPLFDGRNIPNTARAKALVDAGREQLRGTEQTVLLQAATAFFSVQRDIDIVEAYREEIARLRQISQNAQERLRIGELTRTDASQANARLLGSQIALARAQQQLGESRAAFLRIVGRPAETLPQQQLPHLPGDMEMALVTALSNHPLILQARAERRAADHLVDAEIGGMLPSASIRAQYGHTANVIAPGVRENGISIMGQLTIPLYQGGAEAAAVRQAKQRRQQATLNTIDAEGQVRELMSNAWKALAESRNAAELAAQQLEMNRNAYEGAIMESRVGARSVLDILNADQELLQSRITAIAARQNVLTSAYQVISAMGKMTARDLRLPAQLYNPAKHYDETAGRWFGLGD